MNKKRLTIFTLVFALMALLAGAVVNAQDNDTSTQGKRGGFRGNFEGYSTIILDATGLTQAELREALQSGSTIADLITANSGDVNGVVAELVAEATTNINDHVEAGRLTQAQADVLIAGLEENITSRLNGTFERPIRGGFGGNFDEYSTIILDATGLTQAELREALQSGSTIAELIVANGGDVDSVVAELVAEATANINEQTAERIAGLEENITARLNGTFERPNMRDGFNGQGRRGRPNGQGFGFGFGGETDTDSSSDGA